MNASTDDDLEWLLCQSAGLCGERSGFGAFLAVLEGGGSGAFDSGSAEATVERARPHVARARRLGRIYALLDGPTRRLLEAHYLPKNGWAPGVMAALGSYSGAAMAITPDRGKLEAACCHSSLEANRKRIRAELHAAERAVRAAHGRWKDAKAESMLRWIRE